MKDFQHEGLVKWKQMKCVELAMALLAEDLIVNGVCIDIESGKIDCQLAYRPNHLQMRAIKRKEGNAQALTKVVLKQRLVMFSASLLTMCNLFWQIRPNVKHQERKAEQVHPLQCIFWI